MTASSEKLVLKDIKACVFDAYGTLFDFAAAARKCRDVLGDDIDKLTVLWRDKQLQYTWLRAAQGLHADFWQVSGERLFSGYLGHRQAGATRTADDAVSDP
jgi:HAD superfamily hydrolase (TIGR01493 family)